MHAAEEMISLSNILKPGFYVSNDSIKSIEVIKHTFVPQSIPLDEETNEADVQSILEQEAISIKNQIIRDAEMYAEEQLKAALAEIAEKQAAAQAEIEQWWDERRQQDEFQLSQAKEQGFEQGYNEGLVQAEVAIQDKYQSFMDEAQTIIEQAIQTKQQIIHESEPFLIEMSCAIAEKIIGKQVSVSPELIIEMIQKNLTRRREQGVITLCVSPAHFTMIQNARDELTLSIDSQAELQIIPDASVKDVGVVIRSSFGSIDARIDTQLNEIKTVLQRIAVQTGDGSDYD